MANETLDVDFIEVIDAILGKLRDDLGLNDRSCFLMLDHHTPPPPVPVDLFLTISPDGGQFDAAMLIGGDDQQATIDTGVIVSIHSNVRLDPGGRDQEVLMNADRGLLIMLTRVLKALTGFNPVVRDKYCLREYMPPRGFSQPQRLDGEKRSRLDIHFGVSFDWNLA